MSIDTVSDLSPRVQYVAAAAQTAFDYPFPIFADADLVVDVDGVLTTNYTVAGEGEDAGGTVTFLSAMAGGEVVTIYRSMVIERTTDFSQNGEFSSATFNDELDRITLVLQDLRAQIRRSLRLPMTSDALDAETEMAPISTWLDKFVYINASGVPEPASGVTTTALTQAVIGETLWPITPAEIAAGMVAADLIENYRPGNILRYGATEASANIATALSNAFKANAGFVHLDGASFNLTTPVTATITGDVVVYGNAGTRLASTITDAGTYQSAILLDCATTSTIVLRDFELVHTYTSGATLYGIKTNATAYLLFGENVSVRGFPYYAVDTAALQQTHVNCKYSDNVHAGFAGSAGSVTLVATDCNNNGNGSDNTTGYGCVLSGTSARVFGGRFADNDRYGIDGRYCDSLLVDGANVYNTGYVGIYAVNEDGSKDARNLKVVNSTVDMNSRASSIAAVWLGAYSTAGTVSPGEVLVNGNTVKNGLAEGILIATGAGSYPPKLIDVSHNQISTMTGDGISIGGTSLAKSIIVQGNQLQEAHEIQVTSGDMAQITGNSFTYAGAEERVIYSAATKSIITGNSVNGANTLATAIEFTSTSYTVADNQLGSYCKGTATYDPGSLATNASAMTTVTVPGAALGDKAEASFSLSLAGVGLTAFVSAANTVSVVFTNFAGTNPLDLGSGTIYAAVRKER